MRKIILACGLIQSLSAAEDLGGKVTWPADYVLEIHRPISQLAEAKPYLAGVVQNLIADELFLQRAAITRGEVAPSVIEYPVRTDHANLPANERESLLTLFPKPEVLPLRLVRRQSPPAAFECKNEKRERYSLLSRVSGRGSRLRIEIILCQGPLSLLVQSAAADEQELVAAVSRLISPVRAKLTGDLYASLDSETDPPRASVYLDDQFLGKSPLKYSYLIPGKYRLAIKRDGFDTVTGPIEAAAGTTFKQKYQLAESASAGTIDIVSDPPGAKIYLDADYKGVSPKKLTQIPNGTYRLHLLHPEKGEVYRSVTVSDQKPDLRISEKLNEFADQRVPGVFGLRYKTWYYITIATSAACFGTAIGFYVWRDHAQEDIFARLSGKSTTTYTQADYDFIADRNSAYSTRQDYATGFMIGAGAFAALSVYFYVLHLLSADEGIVMRQPSQKEGDVDFRWIGGQPGQAQGIAADFRF
jgi:hypothetical protein